MFECLRPCTDIGLSVVDMPKLLKNLKNQKPNWTFTERLGLCNDNQCNSKLYEVVCKKDLESFVFPLCPNCSTNLFKKPNVIIDNITSRLKN